LRPPGSTAAFRQIEVRRRLVTRVTPESSKIRITLFLFFGSHQFLSDATLKILNVYAPVTPALFFAAAHERRLTAGGSYQQ
jgi:hypothetical protein